MRLLILIGILLVIVSEGWAKETPFTQEDRERLRNVELRLERLETKIEVGFQQIDKRFEDINKRFEDISKRFEDTNKRFGDMMGFMWMLGSVFGGIVVLTIGFAIWDRRTMIRPFETRLRELEEGKIDKLINSLKELARADTKVEEVLRKFNLL